MYAEEHTCIYMLKYIHLVMQIERLSGSQGLHSNSLHPGRILTPLARHMAEADMKAFESPDKQRRSESPEHGAATIVWAAF